MHTSVILTNKSTSTI